MAAALTPPFALAAIVLCVAGIGKLRSPGAAADALGVPAIAVRAFALAELGLGGWALAAPGPVPAALMVGVYASFSGVALLLARRHQPCGCFGERNEPSSAIQSLVSVLLALATAPAVHWRPHALTWLPEHAPVAVIGLAGATYAAVLAYTALPRAWSAWEGGSR